MARAGVANATAVAGALTEGNGNSGGGVAGSQGARCWAGGHMLGVQTAGGK